MSEKNSIATDLNERKEHSYSVASLCYIGVFTAIICVLSQISIPMPAGVPMTLQTLIIPLAGVVLGKKKGTYATLLYLLIGAIGIPVFAGFLSGLGVLLGMTGGFLISFPILSFTAGLGDELGLKLSHKKDGSRNLAIYYAILVASLVIGATINYVFGTFWFIFATQSTFLYAFTACVLPFIGTAILKIILVALIAPELKKRLARVLPN